MLCVGVRISTAPLYVWKGEPTLSVGEILARDYYWDLIVYRVILGQTYLDKMQNGCAIQVVSSRRGGQMAVLCLYTQALDVKP